MLSAVTLLLPTPIHVAAASCFSRFPKLHSWTHLVTEVLKGTADGFKAALLEGLCPSWERAAGRPLGSNHNFSSVAFRLVQPLSQAESLALARRSFCREPQKDADSHPLPLGTMTQESSCF